MKSFFSFVLGFLFAGLLAAALFFAYKAYCPDGHCPLLPCPCPAGGTCTCVKNGCRCGDGCTCDQCPGKAVAKPHPDHPVPVPDNIKKAIPDNLPK